MVASISPIVHKLTQQILQRVSQVDITLRANGIQSRADAVRLVADMRWLWKCAKQLRREFNNR